jgi:isoleucyl-tRNA synthetase
LADVDGNAAKAELDNTGRLSFTLDGGTSIKLAPDDLLIETAQHKNFASESYGGCTVAIDTTLTEDLVEEGNVRELISKIQNMRKEAGFEVVNHIRLGISGSAVFADVLSRNYEIVARETLIDSLIEMDSNDADGMYRKEWKLGQETVKLAVIKI